MYFLGASQRPFWCCFMTVYELSRIRISSYINRKKVYPRVHNYLTIHQTNFKPPICANHPEICHAINNQADSLLTAAKNKKKIKGPFCNSHTAWHGNSMPTTAVQISSQYCYKRYLVCIHIASLTLCVVFFGRRFFNGLSSCLSWW